MIKIIIADDHQVYLDGLKVSFDNVPEIDIIGEALNGKEVLYLLEKESADVVLLDIKMPLMDGLETAAAIKNNGYDVKIIMLTQYDERAFIRRCQALGVEGYLLKDSTKQILVHAIRMVYEGGTVYGTKNGKNNGFAVPDLLLKEEITGNEKRILKLIAEEKSNHEIAELLGISENTIKKQRERLMAKAGVNKTAGLVYWAMKNNLLD
jgi:DNA-binding NarL/FixJ family response regulator